MAFKRSRKWEDMPSSGDLAKLVGCEREFFLERETGIQNSDPTMRARAAAGEAAHQKAQVQMESFHNKGAQDSRCVVASAVYGPDAPETDELRDFRDQSLLPTAAGRAIVKGYYRVSPPIAEFLSKHPRAATPVRRALDGFRKVLSR